MTTIWPQAMLARPELRSLTARFPWAVFGVGPIVLLALSIVGGALPRGLAAQSLQLVFRRV